MRTNTQAELVTELVSHEHASEMGANVEALFMDCLFKDEELIDGKPADGVEPVVAEGITQTVGFHPARLAAARPRVVEVIKRMHDNFIKSKGGGWSFLNLCYDRDDKQWANLHRTMEQFVQLAIGCGLGGYSLPREMWSVMPGGMPYVWFDTSEGGEWPMAEKKQVQCADCWQWVDADKPHTCKQQLRRNKKAAKR